jgi:hypothetical protein
MKGNIALSDYLNRIGATQINFRSYQVKEYRGKYYFEKALIRVNQDGTISADPGYEPTKEEQARIKATWDEGSIPKCVPIHKFNEKMLKKTTPGSIYFVFHNKEGQVIFVQERCVPKAYLPWTYWSDGEWRMMQPDGYVPFWKPFPRVPKEKIMIHEGAKAAKAANEIEEDHPWWDELSQCEHWGLVGGTLSVRRADYPDIRSEQCLDLVYVCDNDWPGRSVLQEFSKQYGGHLVGVKFDKRFPASFDLADPMPKEFFHKKIYIGPPFDMFKQPASFATELIQREKGQPVVVVRKTFREEWLHCIQPEVFVHKAWPSRIYNTKEFNNLVSPYSDSTETAKLLMKDDAGKGYSLSYDPSREPGPYATEGGSFINTYTPSSIKAGPGNIKPWKEFLKHLIPMEEDRYKVERWLATLIAHPEIRMLYGLLLISETQGVGKGTLAEKVLKPLVGELNTSVPREKDIVDSNWNYWLAHKRLAIVHEIYSGHSWKAYNDLKSIITDKTIEVHKKFLADYPIDNWIHIIAMSNSMGAIKLSANDRRWLVPRVTDDKKNSAYWTDFNNWLNHEGGLQIIRRWAEEFNDIVHTGEEAPSTTLKQEIVEDSLGPAQQFVYDLLIALKAIKKRVIITDHALVEIVKITMYQGRETDRVTPLMFRKVAQLLGWTISRTRVKLKDHQCQVRLLCSDKTDTDKSLDALEKDGFTFLNFSKLQTFYNEDYKAW